LAETIHFAVDCFHFGVDAAEPSDLSYSDYVGRVERALRAMPGVSSVEVTKTRLFIDQDAHVEPRHPPMGESREVVPHPWGFGFKLTISIPKDVQVKHRISPDVASRDRIDVDLRSSIYGMPVVFVRPRDCDGTPDAGEAAHLVRMYLRSMWKADPPEGLRFETLGILPPNIECELSGEMSQQHRQAGVPLWLDYRPTPAGDRLFVVFNPDVFAEPEDAFDYLKDETKEELGLLFRTVQIQQSEDREWNQVMSTVNPLSALLADLGGRKGIRHIRRLSRLTEQTMARVTEFQMQRLSDDEFIRVTHEHTRRARPGGCVFWSALEHQRDLSPRFAGDEVLRLVKFAEQRRQHAVTVGTTLAAVVLGAVLGYVLSLISSGRGFCMLAQWFSQQPN